MGSTDEASKMDAKKKLEFEKEDCGVKVQLDEARDPLENGLEEEEKSEPKSSGSEAESDEEARQEPLIGATGTGPPKTPNLDIQGARARYDSESSTDGGKSPSSDRMKR